MIINRKYRIVDWQPGLEKIQKHIYNAAINFKETTRWENCSGTNHLRSFNDPNIPEVNPDDPAFDPKTHLYLVQDINAPDIPEDISIYFNRKKLVNKSKVVGFMAADNSGNVTYPWIILGKQIDSEENRDLLYNEMRKRLLDKNIDKMTTCYNDKWYDIIYFFLKRGFKEVHRFLVVSGRVEDFESGKSEINGIRSFKHEDIDDIVNLPSLKGKYTAESLIEFMDNDIPKENMVLEREGEITGIFSAFITNRTGNISGVSTIPSDLLKGVIERSCTFFRKKSIKTFHLRIYKDAVDTMKTIKSLPINIEAEYVKLESRLSP